MASELVTAGRATQPHLVSGQETDGGRDFWSAMITILFALIAVWVRPGLWPWPLKGSLFKGPKAEASPSLLRMRPCSKSPVTTAQSPSSSDNGAPEGSSQIWVSSLHPFGGIKLPISPTPPSNTLQHAKNKKSLLDSLTSFRLLLPSNCMTFLPFCLGTLSRSSLESGCHSWWRSLRACHITVACCFACSTPPAWFSQGNNIRDR